MPSSERHCQLVCVALPLQELCLFAVASRFDVTDFDVAQVEGGRVPTALEPHQV